MSNRIQVQCPICKKWRWVQKGNTQNGRTKFTGICLTCYTKHPQNFGARNPNWKGGSTVDSRDYRYITISTIEDENLREMCKQSVLNRSYGKKRSGRIYEHHIVMIKKVGRPLTKGEVVHHRDGNPSNNSPENLELTNQRDHTWIHKGLLLENARLKAQIEELRSEANKPADNRR